MKRPTPIHALLAILLAVVMLAASGVAMASPQFSPAKMNCGCGLKKCCVKSAKTDSAPVPAAPARTAQETQLQVVLVLAGQLLAQPAPAEATLSPSHFFVPKTAATPLYQRNCSYLI